jgi:hypothetical protein
MRVRGAGRADRQFISKDRVPWQEDKKQDSFRDRLTLSLGRCPGLISLSGIAERLAVRSGIRDRRIGRWRLQCYTWTVNSPLRFPDRHKAQSVIRLRFPQNLEFADRRSGGCKVHFGLELVPALVT